MLRPLSSQRSWLGSCSFRSISPYSSTWRGEKTGVEGEGVERRGAGQKPRWMGCGGRECPAMPLTVGLVAGHGCVDALHHVKDARGHIELRGRGREGGGGGGSGQEQQTASAEGGGGAAAAPAAGRLVEMQLRAMCGMVEQVVSRSSIHQSPEPAPAQRQGGAAGSALVRARVHSGLLRRTAAPKQTFCVARSSVAATRTRSATSRWFCMATGQGRGAGRQSFFCSGLR